jgi:hypothetical protein
MNIKRCTSGWFFALALLLAACGGDGGIGGTGSPIGTLKLGITDAPSCGYDEVNVTIQKLRVHQVAGAAESDPGWAEIDLGAGRRIDLLSLTNGLIEELGQTTLPAGKYTQLRLVLAPNGGSAPFANSVVPTGLAETALTTPSGQQSGLKINIDIDVPVGKVADFVLDFDACKSVVRRGNSGQYNLKPVIRAIPRLLDAGLRVRGYVDPSIAATASVSLQADGVPVKATVPDPTGAFLLYPVPAGSYDLVVTAAGHVTAVMTAVPVTAAAPTSVNTIGVPIVPALAASAPRSVSGTVTPATATLRALQSLTSGPQIEVAWAPVDADNGAFQFSLTPDAPVRIAYVPNPTVLSFVADTGAAARYTIAATSGVVTLTQTIDVTNVVPSLSFTFP